MELDYRAVYQAWRRFRKGKKPSLAIDEFAYDIELGLSQLTHQLQTKTYRHGTYQKVVVQEKKRRDLAVATVRDRVVHRLLYDYLVKIYDKTFDPDVWSCREGKGLHKCLSRNQKLLGKYPDSFVWRSDIAKFFDNVDHQKLLQVLKRKIGQGTYALWLSSEIVRSYNMVSQSVSQGIVLEREKSSQSIGFIPILAR